MDVWTYFEQKRREVAAGGLTLEDGFQFFETKGSNGRGGRVFGRIPINDRAFLQVNERVEVRDSGIHRISYAYYLVIDEQEEWGYERDPSHDLAVHRHDRDHNMNPCEPVAFVAALKMAWETAAQADCWEPVEQNETP